MIYFDHAATSLPKSKIALEAFFNAANNYANASRGSYEPSLNASRLIYQTREDIKQYFHLQNGEVVFTNGATMSLNIIIKGMFDRNDHVITTTLEHNSVLRPLYEIEKKGVQIDFIPFDNNGVIDINECISKIKSNTKAIIMTMASNVLGTFQPIKEIAKIAHQHNVLIIIDASQAVGHCDINMEELGIDILCFSGHKGLATPRGIGAIVMNKKYEITPLISGGSGFLSFEKKQPESLPEHLEAGSLPIELIASLQAAIKENKEKNFIKEQQLTTYFIEEVNKINNVNVLYPNNKNRCPLVSLHLNNISSDEIMDRLFQEYKICSRGGIHCAPLLHQQLHTENCGLLRFSFSNNNTLDEVKIAIKALKQIMEDV